MFSLRSDLNPCLWATCRGGMSGKASIFPGNAHLAAPLVSRDRKGWDAPLSVCASAQRPLIAHKIFKLYVRITCTCHSCLQPRCGLVWFAPSAWEPSAQVGGKLRPTPQWFSCRKPKPHLEKNVNRWKKKKKSCVHILVLHWPEAVARYMQIIA